MNNYAVPALGVLYQVVIEYHNHKICGAEAYRTQFKRKYLRSHDTLQEVVLIN